ncbi:MAG: class I SAM-dependent methyltransferase [Rhodocyclaceae bacterium]|nr:class I SAM-dependent methyltransferase [Rhodocyclaceae bacterium]
MLEAKSASNPLLQSAEQTEYAGAQELWTQERHLPRYSRQVVKLLSRGHNPSDRVLEFGCGIGTLAVCWRDTLGNAPECLEIDARLRSEVERRGFRCYARMDEVEGAYDRIYSSNVLEHIEDDVSALRQLHAKLQDGGTLAIYVPAFMLIFNNLDWAVGHYRRYHRADLVEKLHAADFDIVDWSYRDCIGFFAWWSIRMRGYSPTKKLGSELDLSLYDRFILPLSSALDAVGFRYLFGKNLLVIAKKKHRAG